MLARNVSSRPGQAVRRLRSVSAIENRVLGWVAGCDEILKVFRDKLDPYVSFACKMYNLPYDVLIKDKDKRQVAMPAVLGRGYRDSPGVKGMDINGNECRDPRLIVSYRIVWQCDECMSKFTANRRPRYVARTFAKTPKETNLVT